MSSRTLLASIGVALVAAALLPIGASRAAAPAAPAAHVPGRVIVKLLAEGPHAITECAETLTRQHRRFRSASADGSDSLDRLNEQLGVRRMRAIFRRPDARPLTEQRERLRARLRPRSARRRTPEAHAPDLSHVYLVELEEGVPVHEAVARFRADPHVAYAQPDYRVEAASAPDDPFYTSTGSWGQREADLWGLHQLDIEPAWATSQGEGIVVAVLDTGLDYDHPDIVGNVWINAGEDIDGNGIVDAADFNRIDDDGNGFIDDLHGFDWANSIDVDGDLRYDGPEDLYDPDPFDDNGHGTHVAGTIAAVADNGVGIAGVAPRAQIMGLKGLDSRGSAPISRLARAVLYAVEHGARVINNSWSCSSRCPDNPVIEEAVRVAHAQGVVTVFSAGNKSDDVMHYSPQNLRETLTVAATTPDDEPAEFSNLGLLLDVAAPGGGSLKGPAVDPKRNILSLRSSGIRSVLEGHGTLRVGEEYLRLAGTSMSAPHASGLAALLLSAHPDWGPEEVRRVIRSSAQDLGPADHDATTGAGRIDAARALASPAPPELSAALTSPALGEVVNQRVETLEIRGTAGGPDFDHYQLYWGPRRVPRRWFPIGDARTEAVENGPLGALSVADRSDGSFAVKLEVTSRDGRTVREFTLASFERNQPSRVSSVGPDARHPRVAGDLVVWDSERRTERPNGEIAPATLTNIFATNLRSGVERSVMEDLGNQDRPAVAGRLVAWRSGADKTAPELAACRLRHPSAPCRAASIPVGPEPGSLALAGDWMVWTDRRDGLATLLTCRWRPALGRCDREQVIAPAGSVYFEVDVDDDRLAWISDLGNSEISTCTLDPRTGACPVHTVPLGPAGRLTTAISGNLVAWDSRFLGVSALYMCAWDTEADTCPEIQIDEGLDEVAFDLSGRRLVWQATRRDDDLDIFFCEFDPILGECPPQRLTGSAATQRAPSIDGTRVVWEDFRNGSWEIFGSHLPHLNPIGDRSVAAGHQLRVRVSGRDPSGAPVGLTATAIGEATLEELGISFRDLGQGRGWLSWRPGAERIGSYVIRFELTSESGLVSRETIRVEVTEKDLLPGIAPWPGS